MIQPRQPCLGPLQNFSRLIYADPPSHDFCVCLIIAELVRRYKKSPAPLRVQLALTNGQLGIFDFAEFSILSGNRYLVNGSREYSDAMIPNVLRPAIEMLGAVEEGSVDLGGHGVPLSAIADCVEYDYHIGHLVDAGREGHEVPHWTPPKWATDEVDTFLDGKRHVVVSLRETPSQPERNSRLESWLAFAKEIENDYDVVFVRDTCRADEPLQGWRTYPRASRNAYVRCALYQKALVNMAVQNGPIVWFLFSTAPYLVFKQLISELPSWDHGQPHGWRIFDHMDVGDQYPWAKENQRLTWKDDTFEDLTSEFDRIISHV